MPVIDADAHEPLLAAYHDADLAGELPLAVVAGKTNSIEVRGLNLDTAKALNFTEATLGGTGVLSFSPAGRADSGR